MLSELEKLAEEGRAPIGKIWDAFGAVLKEGLYEDFERRDALLGLARFKTTAAADGWRSLAEDYVAALQAQPDRDLLRRSATSERLAARRIWKASARAASRCCCWPTRSTASG